MRRKHVYKNGKRKKARFAGLEESSKPSVLVEVEDDSDEAETPLAAEPSPLTVPEVPIHKEPVKIKSSLGFEPSNANQSKHEEPKLPHHDPQYNKKELDAALEVIKKVMKMDSAYPFTVPVDPVELEIPDYFDVIDTPMDFGTVRRNLESGTKYINSESVYKDVRYIWENCYKYFKKEYYIVELMEEVEKNFMKYWEASGLYSDQPKKGNGAEPNHVSDRGASSQDKTQKDRKGVKKHKDGCLCPICFMGRRKKKPQETRDKGHITSLRSLSHCSETPSESSASSMQTSSSEYLPSSTHSTSTQFPAIPPSPEPHSPSLTSVDGGAERVPKTTSKATAEPERRYCGLDSKKIEDLYIEGRRLQPSGLVSRWTMYEITSEPDESAPEFDLASNEKKSRWYSLWKTHFRWNENVPGMQDNVVRRLWEKNAKKRYSDMVGKHRRAKSQPVWLKAEVWRHWLTHHFSSPEFIRKAERQKKIRAKNTGAHTSGSRSLSALKKMMEKELGREVGPLELYMRAHRHDTDRSEEINTRVTKIMTKRPKSGNLFQDECDAYLEAVGGVGPGGAVYGLGSAAPIYYGDRIDTYKRENARVVQVTQENATLRNEVTEVRTALDEQSAKLTEQAAQIETLKKFMEEMRAKHFPPSSKNG